MDAEANDPKFDLHDRTFLFASRVRSFFKRVTNMLSNYQDGKQVILAAGSVGANYIEADEPVGPKDFLLRMRIGRKEAKEARYWLRLLDLEAKPESETERACLV